ncbi:hypothetical protein lerEdw1_019680 [Lerista edwardsae]|nr:hypothetical protein lerEdw1_019680 [Lerista edwardsae]
MGNTEASTMEQEGAKETEEEKAIAKEEQAALIEFYSSFKDLFEFFCTNTTIHGTIRLVCSGRNKMKTAFWALLFLASFAMLYWQFGLIFSQYWHYPVVMSISVHSQPKMFPAVTICNLSPYRVDVVSKEFEELDKLAAKTLQNLYEYPSRNYSLQDNSSVHMGDMEDENPRKTNQSVFRLDPNVALVRLGPRKVGFMLCNASGEDCFNMMFPSGVDAVREWYRFHYMNIMSQVPKNSSIFNKEDHFRDLMYSCQYNGEACNLRFTDYFHHSIYGSCYTINSNGSSDLFKILKPGMVNGLSLILKVDQKSQIPLLSTDAGVRVMIHSHNQTPVFEHEGFDVRPGIESSIGITQDEVNRLGGTYGECTNNGEGVKVKLLYKSHYTLQGCLHSCFQNLMIQKCKCAYYDYPLPDGEKYCNYNEFPNWGHCFYLLYDDLAKHRLKCFEECHKPCKETLYKLSAGYARWPSKISESWIHRALHTQNSYNATSNNSDIAKVNIYYRQLDYNSWDESPEYPVDQVMSNMGSQWSLWFGSSVLSVVEMFEFVIDVAILSLIYFYRRIKARTLKFARSPTISSVSLTVEKYRYVEEGLGVSPSVAKPCDINADDTSAGQNGELPPYSKYKKCLVPELCSGVVLNGFKLRKEHSVHIGSNS